MKRLDKIKKAKKKSKGELLEIALNEKLMSNTTSKLLNDDEYKILDKWFEHNKSVVNFNERTMLIKIYNRVFNKKQKDTRCSSCVRDIINSLRKVYKEY